MLLSATLIDAARAAAAHLMAVERWVETADVLPDNILPLLEAHSTFAGAAWAVQRELLRVRESDGSAQRALGDAITDASLGAGQLGGATLLASAGHSAQVRERARALVAHPAVLASELVRRADAALVRAQQRLATPQRPSSETWHGSSTSLTMASTAFADAAHGWRSVRSVADVDAIGAGLHRAADALGDGLQFAVRHRSADTADELAAVRATTNYTRGFVASYASVARDVPEPVRAEALSELRSFSGFYVEMAERHAALATAAAGP